MSSNTPNLGLLKKDPMVDGNETFNIETMLNDNWDKIDEAVGQSGGYGVTTQPAANAYEVTLSPAPTSLAAGLRVTIKADTASTGAPTLNVNGLGAKPALKASGTPASFKANGVYTLVYDGTAFILQGEGGEVGTAAAGDVLEGKTFPGEDGLIAGTMPKRGDLFKAGSWSNPAGDSSVNAYVDIDGGFYPQGSKVTIQAYDPDLVPSNIRGGTNLFGVQGTAGAIKAIYHGNATISLGSNYAFVEINGDIDINSSLLFFETRSNLMVSQNSSQVYGYFDIFNGVKRIRFQSAEDNIEIWFQIVEFYGVKRKQAGTLYKETGNPINISISTLADVNKVFAHGSYFCNLYSDSPNIGNNGAIVRILDPNTIQLHGSNYSSSHMWEYWSWELLEFY